MANDLQPVDVICQHSADGTLIPMRVRFKDEDGMYQTFEIKGYREIPINGAKTTSDGVYVTEKTYVFECKIYPFGQERRIRLYYEPSGIVWKIKQSKGV